MLQLADEGELHLDDPVEKWLPGAVPDGNRITVRHLLNHTGGLHDYLRTIPFPPDPAFLTMAFAYSNTGYLVLGRIVEEVTGRPYAKEINRRIIRPLGLHATELPGTSPRIRGPHPRGYLRIDGNLIDYTEMNPSVMGAGGELISTTRDLNRFFSALLGGRLLPGHLLAEMKTQGVVGGRKYGSGLAWRETACGTTVYGNDGDALAYQAYSFSTEDRRRRVTVALTPDFTGDPDAAVIAFLDEAFCG